MKPIENNASTIPTQIWNKMQTQTCCQVEFTTEGLTALKNYYAQIQGQPAFNHLLFKLDPASRYYNAIAKNPALFRIEDFNTEGENKLYKTIFRPNGPCCEDLERLAKNPSAEKQAQRGFSAIAWYIHPSQIEGKAILDSQKIKALAHQAPQMPDLTQALKRRNSQVKIFDLQEKYLASILDLSQEDVPYLKHLKERMLVYLEEKYAVDPQNDKVELYFHFPYHPNTVTLHLHARVNQGAHPLEAAGRYDLDQLIEHLEAGQSLSTLILGKKHLINTEMGGCLKELNLPGITIQEIPNPHYIKEKELSSVPSSKAFKLTP